MQRFMIALSGFVPLLLVLSDSNAQQSANQVFRGQVVPLGELVAKIGSQLDADAAPHWLCLKLDDGKIYPLIKDSGSRMFFKDDRLLRRPMSLTGRILPGSQLLQVLEVRSIVKDKPHEVYYWCDICTIKRFEKKICECCGGPMELRETLP